MKKQIIISIIFAFILLSLSGCMGMHNLSHDNHGTANHETANGVPASHGTTLHSGGCH